MGWYLDSVLMGWDGIRILVLMGWICHHDGDGIRGKDGKAMVKRW